MADVQREKGFTGIANQILEALAKTRINGEARQVLDVIFRKTYGFNKKTDLIALSQFVEYTGLHKTGVCKGIAKLKSMNIITQKGNEIAKEYGIIKDFELWKPLPKKVIAEVLPKKVTTITQKGQERNPIGSNVLPKKGTTIERKKIETITKEREAHSEKIVTFFSEAESQQKTIDWLVEKGVPKGTAEQEIQKFVSYWTEPNRTGTKVRWQMEKTFEIQHRLYVWLSRIKDFNKTNNGRTRKWG
jgi:phage replication O-like protein O